MDDSVSGDKQCGYGVSDMNGSPQASVGFPFEAMPSTFALEVYIRASCDATGSESWRVLCCDQGGACEPIESEGIIGKALPVNDPS